MKVADIGQEPIQDEFSHYCVMHVDRLIDLLTEKSAVDETVSMTCLEETLGYYSLFIYGIRHTINSRLTDQLIAASIITPAAGQLTVLKDFWASVDTLIAGYIANRSHLPAETVRGFYKSLADVSCIVLTKRTSQQPDDISDQEGQKTIIHDIRGTKGIIIGAAMLLAGMPDSADREQFIRIIQRNLVKLTGAYVKLSAIV